MRRSNAAALALVVLVADIGLTVAHAAPPEEVLSSQLSRPNIVLIVADDMTWTDSGAYGSSNLATPHIDRLAADGMLFRSAFQSTAMCAVTRQQLYTGLDPVRSGAYPQHSWVRPNTKSLFHYLDGLGYRVGLTGKTHIGPRESFPYEFLGDPADPRESGTGDRDLPAIDFDSVSEFVGRDPEQPFFVVVASHNPHGPWDLGDASKFNPADIHVPPYLVDTPVLREALTRYYAEVVVLDGEVGRVLDILDRQGVAENTIVVFTSEQGSSVPFAKWTLYDAGIRTQLIVRWPGRIAAAKASDAMVSYADIAPTLIDAAGGTVPAGLDGRSFLAVLLGASGIHRSFVYGIHTNFGIIGGDPYPIRAVRSDRYKLIRNLMPDATYRNALNASKKGGWLVQDWVTAASKGDRLAAERIRAYEHRPAVELYEILSDPYEMLNLAEDPGYVDIRATLEAELERWMMQQDDTGVAIELEAYSHINPSIVQWINENYPEAARGPDGRKIRH